MAEGEWWSCSYETGIDESRRNSAQTISPACGSQSGVSRPNNGSLWSSVGVAPFRRGELGLGQRFHELADQSPAVRRPAVSAIVVAAVAVLAPAHRRSRIASAVVDAAVGLLHRVAFGADVRVHGSQGRSGRARATVTANVEVACRLAADEGHMRVVDAVDDDRGWGSAAIRGFGHGTRNGTRSEELITEPTREQIAEARARARTRHENPPLVDAVFGLHDRQHLLKELHVLPAFLLRL